MTRIRFLLCFVLALAGFGFAPALHAQEGEPESHPYIVLFRVIMGDDSKAQGLRLAKVIEPLTGTNAAADVEVPQSFLDAAKKKFEAEKLEPAPSDGKPAEKLVNFLYVSRTPKVAPDAIAPMSLGSLDGIMGSTSTFNLGGQSCQACAFGNQIGSSALFFTYYAVPLSKESK